MNQREIIEYQTINGKSPFLNWLMSLKDESTILRIMARIDRLEIGHFGDTKYLGHGIFELRFHFGPGYRVYFGQDGNTLIILLMGGDKNSQNSDIRCATKYWKEYLCRKNDSDLL